MFTPEFASNDNTTFVLLANHCIENTESLILSILFNNARIKYAYMQLPSTYTNCRLLYDIRGQQVDNETMGEINNSFQNNITVEFKK